jgi:hypothetical protein
VGDYYDAPNQEVVRAQDVLTPHEPAPEPEPDDEPEA